MIEIVALIQVKAGEWTTLGETSTRTWVADAYLDGGACGLAGCVHQEADGTWAWEAFEPEGVCVGQGAAIDEPAGRDAVEVALRTWASKQVALELQRLGVAC